MRELLLCFLLQISTNMAAVWTYEMAVTLHAGSGLLYSYRSLKNPCLLLKISLDKKNVVA